MDAMELLKLQIAWGADEALERAPRDRIAPPAAAIPSSAVPRAPAVPPAPVPGGAVGQAGALAAAAASLDELRLALAGFTACPLQSTAMHLVFADGDPDAAVMLVGDAPGEEEDRTGRPFSGPGGRLLDQMLASIGLDRGQVRLAHAVPWRPPGNRKPTDHERALCLPFLQRHIALVRPRRLVLLGSLPTATILRTPSSSLRRLRGTWQAASIDGIDEPIPALPTCSLDQLIATPANKQQAWADLLTLRVALNDDDRDRQ